MKDAGKLNITMTMDQGAYHISQANLNSLFEKPAKLKFEYV